MTRIMLCRLKFSGGDRVRYSPEFENLSKTRQTRCSDLYLLPNFIFIVTINFLFLVLDFWRVIPCLFCNILFVSRVQVTAFGGDKVIQLLRVIERHHHQFKQPPIGPIGVHLVCHSPAYPFIDLTWYVKLAILFVCWFQSDCFRIINPANQNSIKISHNISPFQLSPVNSVPIDVHFSTLP